MHVVSDGESSRYLVSAETLDQV